MMEIVDYLYKQKEVMVQILKALTKKESPSYEKQLVDKCGRRLLEFFKQYLNGHIEVIEDATFGNQLRVEIGQGEEQILILGHLDTVWPQGTVKQMSFGIVGDRAFGPGVFDMKGGLVQGLFALHALQTFQIPIKKKVVFLITTDEEIGSGQSRELIEREAKKSQYVLVLEPAATLKGKLKTARKGVGIFQIKITGQAAHAGIEPEKGISAIQELAKKILYLHELTDFRKGTTVNVGMIQGGIATNVIAPHAEAEVDIRIKQLKELKRVIPLVEGLTPSQQGLTIEVSGAITRPPMEKTPEVEAMFHKAQKIAKEYLDVNLEDELSGGGSDGSITAQFAPTLDGLGAVGDGAHADHEHIIISQMPVRSALLALLIKELGEYEQRPFP
ncbi:peptidase M20 [Bacillus sp. J14TS2]|uniref:M20 family metallopeptidase n=1 Tax=Bacillus sp. J14TS2 TaxID=2807188 RepID=UPI001B2341E6|nr:M20 family metallopeptidase [Bacillus sp. J14TS2]GIN73698.1 peptidase M20 [Bacillus sp. J14TS2]